MTPWDLLLSPQAPSVPHGSCLGLATVVTDPALPWAPAGPRSLACAGRAARHGLTVLLGPQARPPEGQARSDWDKHSVLELYDEGSRAQSLAALAADGPSVVSLLLLLLGVSLPAEHLEMAFPLCHGFAHIPKFQVGSQVL